MPYSLSEIAIYWHEDGVLATFPISEGRYRIIADIGLSQGDRPADPTLAEVQAIFDRRGPGGLKAADPIWLSGFRINERKVANIDPAAPSSRATPPMSIARRAGRA